MNFYKECIAYEVYASNRYNPIKKYKIRTYNPTKNAVYLLRMYQYHANATGGLKFVHNFIAKIYYKKLFTSYNIFLHPTTKIGKGLSLPHPTGIVLGGSVEIGENCRIFQHVTLGGKHIGDYKLKNQPVVGDNCTIFAGACVLGGIHIGDNTTIGCNSVITKDTEENSTYVGVSKRIK